MSGKDYQKMLEEAERQTEAGETPPPSTSPIHMLENNNNNVGRLYRFNCLHIVLKFHSITQKRKISN